MSNNLSETCANAGRCDEACYSFGSCPWHAYKPITMNEKIYWGTNKVLRFFEKTVYIIVGIIAAIIYIACLLVNIIVRIPLGLSYYGMGEFHKGRDVFRFLFKPYDREF